MCKGFQVDMGSATAAVPLVRNPICPKVLPQ